MKEKAPRKISLHNVHELKMSISNGFQREDDWPTRSCIILKWRNLKIEQVKSIGSGVWNVCQLGNGTVHSWVSRVIPKNLVSSKFSPILFPIDAWQVEHQVPTTMVYQLFNGR